MEIPGTANPSVTVALAMVIGLLTQATAHHLRIPGIILLLLMGVLLGPDGAGLIQPSSLGNGLHTIVGFAVAIILFEGGMCLNLDRIRREGKSIRRLITLGAVVTAIGGTLAAHYLMGWSWRISGLFGSLVVVTGPTVVSPLLKRLAVKRSVSTVLEAEGVLIDAIGAIGAVVALEIAIQPTGEQVAIGARNVIAGLGLGSLMGLIGGFLLTFILRIRNLIPEGLEQVFTLTAVLAIFQVSNDLIHESGIAAVTVAGMVVGNARFHVLSELHAFKEQLTVMLIGMLFILLAADVRVAEVQALGAPGLLVVAALIFVVRPITVFLSTAGSTLHWKEKAFISWIGPRGIIAAAVASLFASTLAAKNMEGGSELRAMVFLVIAVTVLLSGFTGGPIATLLKLKRPKGQGWLILGANPLAVTMARILQKGGQEILCIDSDAAHCKAAERQGVRVLFGNALENRILKRAEIDTRRGAIGLSANEAVNLLFTKNARHACKVGHFPTLLKTETTGITPDMVAQEGCQLLFGGWRNIAHWCTQIANGRTQVQWWEWHPRSRRSKANYFEGNRMGHEFAIPMVQEHRKKFTPIDDKSLLRSGDKVAFLVRVGKNRAFSELMDRNEWVPIEAPLSKQTQESAPDTLVDIVESPVLTKAEQEEVTANQDKENLDEATEETQENALPTVREIAAVSPETNDSEDSSMQQSSESATEPEES